MPLWITGAKGLVATHLCKRCEAKGVSYLASGKELDITHLPSLFAFAKTHRPSHIVNCAAYTKVDLAETHQDLAYAINEKGAAHLAEVACKEKIPLIHLSTNYVFNGTQESYDESAPCQPLNIYGMSKRKGEEAIQTILPTACILRTSWIFGTEGTSFLQYLLRAFQEEKTIVIAADQIASLTYAWDLADAILALKDKQGIFHFANQGALTRYDFAEELLLGLRKKGLSIRCETLQKAIDPTVHFIAKRPRSSPFNLKKYTAHVGPPRHWKEALKEALDVISM